MASYPGLNAMKLPLCGMAVRLMSKVQVQFSPTEANMIALGMSENFGIVGNSLVRIV